jgi:hypothetical protein
MARKASPKTETQPAKPRATRTPKPRSKPASSAQSGTAVAEPPGADAPPVEPTIEQIRARAYEIYRAHGGRGGDPQADWLQAERELRGPTD